ncbi:MAG: hypothetical protein CK425_04565 [Parachlamydia sp.]|nr:MAG: hypothetical protein CK425_04565 [Parachlamydia sp.]
MLKIKYYLPFMREFSQDLLLCKLVVIFKAKRNTEYKDAKQDVREKMILCLMKQLLATEA